MNPLPCYVMQFNRAIAGGRAATPHSCNFRCCSRDELARLQYDSVAQVLSYFPVSYIPTLPGRFSHSIRYHTLAAVSPRARLYAEAMVLRSSTDTCFEGVQVSEDELVYWITLCGREPNLPRLALALWWSERCGLPIVLNAPNACPRLLTMLSARWRMQVQRLRLWLRATLISDNIDASSEKEEDDDDWNKPGEGGQERDEWDRTPRPTRWAAALQLPLRSRQYDSDTLPPVRLSCSTFLNALPSFAYLNRLAIAGEYAADPLRTSEAVTGAFHVVKSMLITEVELLRCEMLASVSELAGAPCLERLTVRWSSIANLEGLASCSRLSFVGVSENSHLSDLSGLAGAPRLQELLSSNCALIILGDLNKCPSLRLVDISENPNLYYLHGLADAPRLEMLNVSHTAVSDIAVLHSCRSLARVDVRGCPRIRNIAPLSNFDVLADMVV